MAQNILVRSVMTDLQKQLFEEAYKLYEEYAVPVAIALDHVIHNDKRYKMFLKELENTHRKFAGYVSALSAKAKAEKAKNDTHVRINKLKEKQK